MFDGYIYTEGSEKPVWEDDKIVGFDIATRIPYYRGIPLSMVHDVEVVVDGKPVERETIRFSADNGEHWFTLDELWTVSSFRWEYADEAIVRVMRPDGLGAGEHDVTLRVSIRVAYIPVPFSGENTRKVVIPAS
ncbi:hypothetical protein H8R18_00525 [Nanchangia anserum]|uniref:C-glycoside deglycosidase beta subunit domain-containing protein n=1 Tax=Nanchangia anserum TaxID=2692125 RepID=UPI001883D839|nr:DUF6379 domain-containing protein [Nanchangia anserum]QOX81902.1 hypothetical protein H8R18_00525 [Nanchangia anserum]